MGSGVIYFLLAFFGRGCYILSFQANFGQFGGVIYFLYILGVLYTFITFLGVLYVFISFLGVLYVFFCARFFGGVICFLFIRHFKGMWNIFL